MNFLKQWSWFIFCYPIIHFRLLFLKKKNKKLNQQCRLNLYNSYPPIEGDVGIGYKRGKIYDYIYKEYIKKL
jgi:hypothetical protein